MIKRLARPWVCARCLRQQRRGLVGLASAAAQEEHHPPPHIAPNASHVSSTTQDDADLRRLFDSPSFWKNFSRSPTHQLSGRRTGLLQNKYLTDPEGFHRFTSHALKKCRGIVDRVLKAQSVEDYKRLVRDLDRLSDQLCRVIDLVDFIRNVHPDSSIQAAATQSHAAMYEYMNILNTTTGLYDQLKQAALQDEVSKSWTEEEKVTARVLLKDFAQSAIHGQAADREKFVSLSNDILRLGTEFLETMSPEKYHLKFPSSKLKGMDPVAAKHHTHWGTTSIPVTGTTATQALKTVEDAEIREQLYRAHRTSSAASISLVEAMLHKRASLARLSQYPSFGHMTLSGTMARTPEAVQRFLYALAAQNKATLQPELAALEKLKGAPLNAWDRPFYSRQLQLQGSPASLAASRPRPNALSSYFSLGTVMQGLSRLFSRLYGVRLVPQPTAPGEVWHDDVRRLDVLDETHGRIAVLYCDLFSRPGKFPNPAHFTLRCSREIGVEEVRESAASLPSAPSLDDLADTLNDGMALNWGPASRGSHSRAADGKGALHRATRGLHQLPTIAFICDFPRPQTGDADSQPSLLSHHQLSTLYHEMGHCIHSILGRTSLQNVAGTRCATDFAELPSILMEHFAADKDVLALYARHWQTDEPLDTHKAVAEIHRRAGTANGANGNGGGGGASPAIMAWDTEQQILLSVLDQVYHSPRVLDPSFSSSETYHDIFSSAQLTSLPEPRGTAWQGFFGHLVGYGAVYYSYLFDRALAGKVWAEVFEGRATERSAGERFREGALRWGGGRDGWECLVDTLGGQKGKYGWMREGGEEAMMEVGRWGASEMGGAGAPA